MLYFPEDPRGEVIICQYGGCTLTKVPPLESELIKDKNYTLSPIM